MFDPRAAACTECPSNLLLVGDSPALYDALNRIGVYAGLAWSLALVGLLVLRLARSSPGAPPAALAGAASRRGLPRARRLGLRGQPRPRRARQRVPIARDLWLGQAAALVALAAGVVWGWIRARHTRAAVARLVVEVAASPGPGGLRDKLARHAARRRRSKVAYPLADGRLVDALGRPHRARRRGDSARPQTERRWRCCRTARTCSTIPALAEEVAAAARLALENERLQAEMRAQLEHLRSSRTRVVADRGRRASAPRARSPRWRAAAAGRALAPARSHPRPPRRRLPTLRSSAQIDEAQAELGAALAGLREIGHGLFPALLAEEGLAAALEALTEEAPVEIEIGALPERLDAAVDAAAYFVVSEALEAQPGHPAQARGTEPRTTSSSSRWKPTSRPSEIVALEDRVGAAGGTLEVDAERRRASEHPRGDPVRVVIADDEVLLREGLERLLLEAGFDVVGKVGTADELLRKVELARPDVAIVDIRMPPTHTDEGIVAAQEIRRSHPEVGVLVLSHHLESRYAMRLIEQHPGGAGYLLKQRVSNLGVLTDALGRLRDGECVVDPTIVARLVQRARPARQLAELTEREREVLALMAEGRSNKAICAQLFLSPKTIEAHVKHIFRSSASTSRADDHRRVLAVLAYLRS